jgi:hypothetical protein
MHGQSHSAQHRQATRVRTLRSSAPDSSHARRSAAQQGTDVQAAHRLLLRIFNDGTDNKRCEQEVIYNTSQFSFDFCLSVDVVVVRQVRLTQR